MLSSAALRPVAESVPAPSPFSVSAPNWILLWIGLRIKACLSVLHTTKTTSLMPFVNMWLTALLPPPPTPITLIIGASSECFGSSITNS